MDDAIKRLREGDQSPETCLEAVKQYGRALKYVKEQTLELCLVALKEIRAIDE